MSTRLGNYVIDEAASQAAAWRSQTPGRALPVAINVSGSHFESDDLVVQLAHALRTNDLEPGASAGSRRAIAVPRRHPQPCGSNP